MEFLVAIAAAVAVGVLIALAIAFTFKFLKNKVTEMLNKKMSKPLLLRR